MDPVERRRRTVELERAAKEIRAAKRLRYLIILFSGVVLIGLMASIQLSMVSLKFGTMVYGHPSLKNGEPAFFRILPVDGISGSLLPAASVQGRVVEEIRPKKADRPDKEDRAQEGRVTMQGTGRAAGLVSLKLSPNNTRIEHPALALNIDTPRGEEYVLFELSQERSGPRMKLVPLVSTLATNRHIIHSGPDALRLYPLALEAVRGINNPFIAVITKQNKPSGGKVAAEFRPKHIEFTHMPLNNATAFPPITFMQLEHTQTFLPESLQFSFENTASTNGTKRDNPPPKMPSADRRAQTPHSATLAPKKPTLAIPIAFRARQIVMRVRTVPLHSTEGNAEHENLPAPRAILSPGEDIEVIVETLPFTEPLFIDAWIGDRLFFATAQSPEQGSIRVPVHVPEHENGLLRIEAYRALWDVDSTLSQRNFWVSPAKRAGMADAIAFLLDLQERSASEEPTIAWAEQAQGQAQEWLLAMALSRVASETPGMPLLVNTLPTRKAQVEDFVRRVRTRVHNFVIFTVLIFAGLLLIWIHREHKRRSRALDTVLNDAHATGEIEAEDHTLKAAKTTGSMETYFNIGMAILSMILLAYGLWMLLSVLNWRPGVW